MRKIVMVLLGALATLLAAQTACAEEYEFFYLEKPDLEITVPGGFVVFTRDMNPDHPNFARMGYTWEQVTENMEKGDVYLDALTPDGNLELLVVSVDFPAEDLHLFSEAQVKEIVQVRTKQLEAEGAQGISTRVIEHHQVKFLQIDYSSNLGWTTGYAREYYTLYADKIIDIALSSYDGRLTAEQEALLTGIIDSVYFGTEPLKNGDQASHPVPKYTDDLTGLTISPPNLWTEAPISRLDGGLFAQFIFSANTEKRIRIYSRDLFCDMVLAKLFPNLDREQLPRGDAGHALLSTEIVAELLACEVTEVSNTRYGGREYFRANIVTTVKMRGKQQPMPAYALVRMEDGYIYIFQYIGATNDGSFLNFRRMVANAVYPSELPEETEPVPEPEMPPDTGEVTVPPANVPEEDFTAIAGKVILWTVPLGLALAITACCVIIGGKGKRRRTVDPVECDPWEKPEPEPERRAPENIVYCRKCGTQLRTSHRFCYKCGTENILFNAEDQKSVP